MEAFWWNEILCHEWETGSDVSLTVAPHRKKKTKGVSHR